MSRKSKNRDLDDLDAREQGKNRDIGNQQGTTQTGGSNQGGQRSKVNYGERSRDQDHQRGNRDRKQS